jgi:hypothetical protein
MRGALGLPHKPDSRLQMGRLTLRRFAHPVAVGPRPVPRSQQAPSHEKPASLLTPYFPSLRRGRSRNKGHPYLGLFFQGSFMRNWASIRWEIGGGRIGSSGPNGSSPRNSSGEVGRRRTGLASAKNHRRNWTERPVGKRPASTSPKHSLPSERQRGRLLSIYELARQD